MKKALIVAVIIVFGASVYALVWSVRQMPGVVERVFGGDSYGSSASLDYARIDVPADPPPPNSIVVAIFRPSGDAEAKHYAIGFARALADRLHCAPKCVTLQYSTTTTGQQMSPMDLDTLKAPTDEQASKLGKTLGVRWVVSGDFELTGGSASIRAQVIDLSGEAEGGPIELQGGLSDLPALQKAAVDAVAKRARLEQNSARSSALLRPNFANPKVLSLYGRSVLADDIRTTEALRWEAVKLDPNSDFAVIRLLEFYAYGPAGYREIAGEKRLSGLIADAGKRSPGNSHIALLKGMLLTKQYEYQAAEDVLRQLVDDDPRMCMGRSALARLARERKNAQLAMDESLEVVSQWPTNARYRASLASSYGAAASRARQGRYYGKMTARVEREWRKNSEDRYREAVMATRLDPNCSLAWRQILNVARELGIDGDIDRAYRELLRIDPKDSDAYISYAFAFSPQWGGSDADQERIMDDVDKVYGKGTWEAEMVRGLILLGNSPSGEGRVGGGCSQEIMRLADDVSSKCKTECEGVMLLKCRAYMVTRRRAEFLQVADQGFERWRSPEWRYMLGMGLAFRYEDKRDRADLDRAEQVWAKYVKEIPYDPRGHIQWGWCLSHQGKREEAKARFLKALEIDPGNEKALEKLKYVE